MHSYECMYVRWMCSFVSSHARKRALACSLVVQAFRYDKRWYVPMMIDMIPETPKSTPAAHNVQSNQIASEKKKLIHFHGVLNSHVNAVWPFFPQSGRCGRSGVWRGLGERHSLTRIHSFHDYHQSTDVVSKRRRNTSCETMPQKIVSIWYIPIRRRWHLTKISSKYHCRTTGHCLLLQLDSACVCIVASNVIVWIARWAIGDSVFFAWRRLSWLHMQGTINWWERTSSSRHTHMHVPCTLHTTQKHIGSYGDSAHSAMNDAHRIVAWIICWNNIILSTQCRARTYWLNCCNIRIVANVHAKLIEKFAGMWNIDNVIVVRWLRVYCIVAASISN